MLNVVFFSCFVTLVLGKGVWKIRHLIMLKGTIRVGRSDVITWR